MTGSGPAGLILTPGAAAGRDQPGLVAIDQAVTQVGVVVERVEFPGQAAGKRRPDPPAVCIQTIRTATSELADRLGVPTSRVAVGGRSMGGRMCSMAVAEGLEVAALVLVSYPLHPPGQPDKLRTGHLATIRVPVLVVQGTRDPLCPLELLAEVRPRMKASNVLLIVDGGDHSLAVSAAARKARGETQAHSNARVLEAIRSFCFTARAP